MTEIIIAGLFLAGIATALGLGGVVLDAYERWDHRRQIDRRAEEYRR